MFNFLSKLKEVDLSEKKIKAIHINFFILILISEKKMLSKKKIHLNFILFSLVLCSLLKLNHGK